MDHIQAIQKLIDRNKNFVLKNGTSAYTRDTDNIINALLNYVHTTEDVSAQLDQVTQNRSIVFELFGIPEALADIDNEFLQRYIKFDVVSNVYLSWGFEPENYTLDEHTIIRAYESACKRIQEEIALFNSMKILHKCNPQFVKRFYPHFDDFITYNTSDEEIYQYIKRKIYYAHE
jgi:hypothetical protein